jgi:dodecin
VIAQSPNGFDDACREAIKEAAKTLRGINSFWIKNAECVVENDQITMFLVNGKISFFVEENRWWSRPRVIATTAGLGARSTGNANLPGGYHHEFASRQFVGMFPQCLVGGSGINQPVAPYTLNSGQVRAGRLAVK